MLVGFSNQTYFRRTYRRPCWLIRLVEQLKQHHLLWEWWAFNGWQRDVSIMYVTYLGICISDFFFVLSKQMIISQEQYSKCIQIHYLSLIHGTMWQNAIFLSQKLNLLKFIHSEKATKIERNIQSSFEVMYIEAISLRIDRNTLFPYWDLTRKAFTRFFFPIGYLCNL